MPGHRSRPFTGTGSHSVIALRSQRDSRRHRVRFSPPPGNAPGPLVCRRHLRSCTRADVTGREIAELRNGSPGRQVDQHVALTANHPSRFRVIDHDPVKV